MDRFKKHSSTELKKKVVNRKMYLKKVSRRLKEEEEMENLRS